MGYELSRRAGFTLVAEVRQDRNICSAFVQLVHLETRKTRVTRPEYYDCTRHDLVELAGDLSEELTGKRAPAPAKRKHRRATQPPLKIVVHGRKAEVDGVPRAATATQPADNSNNDNPYEEVDLERWPALQPYTTDDGSQVFNLYELGHFIARQSALTASAVLAWPIWARRGLGVCAQGVPQRTHILAVPGL